MSFLTTRDSPRLWAFVVVYSCVGFPSIGGATTLGDYQNTTQTVVGSVPFRWLGFHIYDATLFSPTGAYAQNTPFVLELKYHRNLTGGAVANTTLQEMQRLGFNNPTKAAKWNLLLTDWFSNIAPNTKLAAMRNADGSTTFVRNGKHVLGTIQDADFTRYFFAIWLGNNTRSPKLRNQLIGLN